MLLSTVYSDCSGDQDMSLPNKEQCLKIEQTVPKKVNEKWLDRLSKVPVAV